MLGLEPGGPLAGTFPGQEPGQPGDPDVGSGGAELGHCQTPITKCGGRGLVEGLSLRLSGPGRRGGPVRHLIPVSGGAGVGSGAGRQLTNIGEFPDGMRGRFVSASFPVTECLDGKRQIPQTEVSP